MMLEVCAWKKPGNVDRCHDYSDTWLEHFLATMIFARPAFEAAEEAKLSIGDIFYNAVLASKCHTGGNTHFGAFLLLIPLIYGKNRDGAADAVKKTTVDDAILFHQAFSQISVRVREKDEKYDINDPFLSERLRTEGQTMYSLMAYSADHDMVAREWTNTFALSQWTASRLCAISAEQIEQNKTPENDGKKSGKKSISKVFLELMAKEPDTFIAKKWGMEKAKYVQQRAVLVQSGDLSLETFDSECISKGINPGSLADIMIAGLYLALMEGWSWE
jgi:triphosphoribosyl-dephospho-CoA synthase